MVLVLLLFENSCRLFLSLLFLWLSLTNCISTSPPHPSSDSDSASSSFSSSHQSTVPDFLGGVDSAADAAEYYEQRKHQERHQRAVMVTDSHEVDQSSESDHSPPPAKRSSAVTPTPAPIDPDYLSSSSEQALYQRLLGRGYLKHVRPVRNHSQPIVVKVGMCVMMIEDLIERDQIMIMASCVKMNWVDEYLKWDPTLFDNVTWMAISSDKIWLPDIAIVNSPEPHALTRKITNLDLNYRGEVGYFPSGRLATRCNLVITYFPFDWQHCEVRFESWIYPTKYLEIHLYPGDEAVDLKEYYVNFQWTIKGYDIKPEVVDYDGKNFSSITFTFTLRRKPAFYFMYFIFPELLLALLQTLSHTLPVEHPGRMTMLTALFIGTTVTHSGIASHIPKSSDTMSLLQVYMSIMSINLVLALLITFVMLYTVLRYPHVEPSFMVMMVAFFSIVWPSKPQSNRNRSRDRRHPRHHQPHQHQQKPIVNSRITGDGESGRRAVVVPSTEPTMDYLEPEVSRERMLKRHRKNHCGSRSQEFGEEHRQALAGRGMARDLSDLYLNRSGHQTPVAEASSLASTSCFEESRLLSLIHGNGMATLAGGSNHSGDSTKHHSASSLHPRTVNPYEPQAKFNPNLLNSSVYSGQSYSYNNRGNNKNYYDGGGSNATSRRSSINGESGGAEMSYMSAQRCLSELPQQLQHRMVVTFDASSPPSSRHHSQRRQPSLSDVERSVDGLSNRTTSTLKGNNNKPHVGRSPSRGGHDKGGNNSSPLKRQKSVTSDDHELKRRWLIYCVALDKSIMYANFVWNLTIPIALFVVVPYLHELMLSPDMSSSINPG